jgi:HSP20 family protein
MTARKNPFEDIEEMIDLMTGQFGTGGELPVDVVDADDSFVVRADLPGYAEDDIEVTLLDEHRLSIGATRDPPDDEGAYVRRERRTDGVSRTVRLPEAVETEDTGATYEAGVLTVTLGKRTAGAGTGTDIPVE